MDFNFPASELSLTTTSLTIWDMKDVGNVLALLKRVSNTLAILTTSDQKEQPHAKFVGRLSAALGCFITTGTQFMRCSQPAASFVAKFLETRSS